MYWKYLLIIFLCLFDNAISKKRRPNRHKKDPNIKRPENGTGTILISYENVTLHSNDRRILVVFDLICVDNIDESDERLMSKIDHIRQRYINCIDLYNLSAKHYDTANYSYVWMDLKCPLAVIQEKKNITIDYDDLCIEYIMYEPLFWPNQTTQINVTTISSPTTTTSPTHECNNMSTDLSTSWGLDSLDSPWLDGRFSFVDIDTVRDNPDGLDLFIIDSGVQAEHIEFEQGQVIHVMGDGPATITSNSRGTLYDAHGTHVAGSISGMNYGSSRGFPIYDYRVCEFDEELEVPCYTSLITDAMDRVLKTLQDNGSRRGIINLSLGGEKSYAMNDIYHAYFDKFIANGGIPVVAAGNEDQDACDVSPAYSSKAITVGAYNQQKEKAWYSNWGNCVDIWGPGSDIYSAIPSATETEYGTLSGTSMATPMIAGIIANLLVIQPTLSFDGILTALKNNSVSITGDACDAYDCVAPVYSCGKRVYGDPIPFKPETGFSTFEIVLIVIGCCLFLFVVIVVILYCLKDKKDIPHTTIPDEDNPNVVANEEEQQAIMGTSI